MESLKLEAQERKIFGKKIKKLRQEGLIPANVFGRDIKSLGIQVKGSDFNKIWKKAGETSLVDLSIGESKTRPVFIKAVQKDPVTGLVLHADFQQVNLKEKITAIVPLVLEGESPIEQSGEGLVLQTLNELEVEALPTEIPHEVKVDISKLNEIGQTVHVKDLAIPKEVEVKTDPEAVVVSVQTAEMKEEVVEEAPAEPEVIAEKPGEAEEQEAVEEAKTAEGKKETEEKE